MKLIEKLKRALGLRRRTKRRIKFLVDEKGVLHIDHSVMVHGDITSDGHRLLRINVKMPERKKSAEEKR